MLVGGHPSLKVLAERTKELAAKLAEQGMPVAFLEGGLLGWEAAGLPLDRPD